MDDLGGQSNGKTFPCIEEGLEILANLSLGLSPSTQDRLRSSVFEMSQITGLEPVNLSLQKSLAVLAIANEANTQSTWLSPSARHTQEEFALFLKRLYISLVQKPALVSFDSSNRVLEELSPLINREATMQLKASIFKGDVGENLAGIFGLPDAKDLLFNSEILVLDLVSASKGSNRQLIIQHLAKTNLNIPGKSVLIENARKVREIFGFRHQVPLGWVSGLTHPRVICIPVSVFLIFTDPRWRQITGSSLEEAKEIINHEIAHTKEKIDLGPLLGFGLEELRAIHFSGVEKTSAYFELLKHFEAVEKITGFDLPRLMASSGDDPFSADNFLIKIVATSGLEGLFNALVVTPKWYVDNAEVGSQRELADRFLRGYRKVEQSWLDIARKLLGSSDSEARLESYQPNSPLKAGDDWIGGSHILEAAAMTRRAKAQPPLDSVVGVDAYTRGLGQR